MTLVVDKAVMMPGGVAVMESGMTTGKEEVAIPRIPTMEIGRTREMGMMIGATGVMILVFVYATSSVEQLQVNPNQTPSIIVADSVERLGPASSLVYTSIT